MVQGLDYRDVFEPITHWFGRHAQAVTCHNPVRPATSSAPFFSPSTGYSPAMNLVKSKKRVVDHGEVFTPPWMVEAMLDLVKAETERIDSRVLAAQPDEHHHEVLSMSQPVRLLTLSASLMALPSNNVSLECCRGSDAGEQDRGFATWWPARCVAYLTPFAAKEIKTLIGDSVDKVESGVQLVDKPAKPWASGGFCTSGGRVDA